MAWLPNLFGAACRNLPFDCPDDPAGVLESSRAGCLPIRECNAVKMIEGPPIRLGPVKVFDFLQDRGRRGGSVEPVAQDAVKLDKYHSVRVVRRAVDADALKVLVVRRVELQRVLCRDP